MLSLVSTPIGNLEDITYRAVRTLKEADIIICEDTRKSKILLDHYQIYEKPLISFHSHSGEKEIQKILSLLENGKHCALISDAGTPGISDPGYWLIKRVIEAGYPLSPLPGPSALLAGLICSGMHMHEFLYLGFLPIKKGRKTLLESLKQKKQTVVFYESVHRIEKTINELVSILGNETRICIARELTKKFEDFFRGTLQEAQIYISKNEKRKGEFVVIL